MLGVHRLNGITTPNLLFGLLHYRCCGGCLHSLPIVQIRPYESEYIVPRTCRIIGGGGEGGEGDEGEGDEGEGGGGGEGGEGEGGEGEGEGGEGEDEGGGGDGGSCVTSPVTIL